MMRSQPLPILLICFSLLLTGLSQSASAQVSAYYIWSQSSSVYTPGVPAGEATPASVFDQTWDDDVTVYPLPFAFNFNGTTYPAGTGYIGLDSDGWFTFSNGVPTMTGTLGGGSWVSISDHTGVYLYGTGNNNGFAGFNGDLNSQNLATFTGNITSGSATITAVSSFTNVRIGTRLNASGIPVGAIVIAFNAGAGTITLSANATATAAARTITPSSSIYAFTRGTAPNRQFVVQWTQTKRYNSPSITGDNFNFQMILNEGGGVASLQTLQVIYGDVTATNTNNLDMQVGLRGASSADFNARTSLTSWAATTAATANNQHVRFNNTQGPASGLTYTWSPCTTSPGAAGAITGTGTVCPNTNFSYTLPLVTNATYYVWTYTGSGVTFNDTTSTPQNTLYYGALATGGTLTVTPRNLCGSGTPATRAISVVAITPASISYPSGIVCTSTGVTNVTRTGPSGGTYTAAPAGLTMNATTGQITPGTSAPGSYTVTYTYTSGTCTGTTTTGIQIESGPAVVLQPSVASGCVGSSFNLQAQAIANMQVQGVAHHVLTPSAGTTTIWNTYQDDALSAAIPIPFTFNFYGAATTQLFVSTNGYVQLQTSTANSLTPQNLPNPAAPNNLIALCWDDLILDPSTHPGANIRYFTNGTAPNRIFVIEYNQLRFLGGSSAENVTGQIRLYEGNNDIQIAVVSINDDGNNYTKTLGVENATGTLGISPAGRNNTGFQAAAETWRFFTGGPYSYAWSPATYLNNTTIPNPVATNVTSGINYTVRVTHSVSGCYTDSVVTVQVNAPLNGTYTVGSGGDYPTLTAAVNAYNTLCLGGHVLFSLTDATYSTSETFPIIIKSRPDADANHTLTIKPATGVTATITGNNASGIIHFQGAEYVTIDGSNTTGGDTRNLTVKNTSTNSSSSSVIWLYPASASDGCNYNSIRNTIVLGNSRTTTVCGILSSGFGSFGSVSETANNNNTFHNNKLNLAQSGIVLVGPVGNEQNNQITLNEFGGTTNANKMGWSGIEIYQQANTLVSKNNISGVYTTSSSIDVSGIVLLGTHQNVQITQNIINDVRHNSIFGAHGIYLGSSSTAANVTVSNNFISNIATAGYNGFSSSDNGYGIVAETGGGYNIWFNSVSMFANTSSTGAHRHAAMLISSSITTASSLDVRNNIFSITQANGNTNSRYAMICLAANNVFAANNYNVYWSSSGNLLSRGTSTNYTTLANLQANIGGNVNSLNVQPNFAAIGSGNLHLVAASNNAISNAGQPIAGITLDIDSTTRNALTPDIGADEFVTPNYGSWVGRVSTEWTNPFNWEANFVPLATTDVQIKGGFTHMPTVTTVQPMRNLALSTGVPGSPPVLTLQGGTIQVYGIMSYGGGTIDGLHGSLEMMAANAQTVPAGIFLNNSLGNLIISNSHVATGVSLGGTLDIYRSVTFTASGRRLATNGHLTFKSTATETAWLGDVTGKVIVGDATVERYIHTGTGAGMHPKAWQFLSVPTSGTQTIRAAWQEGATTPNANPVPGFGTQITSNITGATGLGFDVYTAPGPSMKTYNAANNQWTGVPNTTTQTLPNGKGYMIFIRGDRSVTTHTAAAVPTIMRTKGKLFTTGADAPPAIAVTAGQMASAGNPYPSAIDFRTLNRSNLSDVFYLWDPYLTTGGSSAWGLGGFQTFTLVGADYVVTPGGGRYGAPGSVNNIIQSGQAFIVQSSQPSGGTNGILGFSESAKVSGSALVHRTTHTTPVQLRTSLYVMPDDSLRLIDGVLHLFDEEYSHAVDGGDARKMMNTGENLSILRNADYLVVERLAAPHLNDTLQFHLSQVRNATYQFVLDASGLNAPGRLAFLEDTWLQTYTVISLQGETRYRFEVNQQAGSRAAKRFRIIFKTAAPLPVASITLTAARNNDYSNRLQWQVTGAQDMQEYIPERSRDGVRFSTWMPGVPAQNQFNVQTYYLLDTTPFAQHNYYRIRAVSMNGTVQYSNIAHVLRKGKEPVVQVSPNPLVNQTVQIQYAHLPAGVYHIRLLNEAGQTIQSVPVSLDGAGSFRLPVDAPLAKGVYYLQLKGQGLHFSVRILQP